MARSGIRGEAQRKSRLEWRPSTLANFARQAMIARGLEPDFSPVARQELAATQNGQTRGVTMVATSHVSMAITPPTCR